MITMESLAEINKDDPAGAADRLDHDDIRQLVEWLALKDDAIRYAAFLLLQSRSSRYDDVYPYWDVFKSKLTSDNSYQRSIGLMLIAENAGWDAENRLQDTLDGCLALLNDEKPITVRQCIQSLGKIASRRPELGRRISGCLISLDLDAVRETMRKSILLDILNTLLIIRETYRTDETEGYILAALSGGLLDKKSKKQIADKL